MSAWENKQNEYGENERERANSTTNNEKNWNGRERETNNHMHACPLARELYGIIKKLPPRTFTSQFGMESSFSVCAICVCIFVI